MNLTEKSIFELSLLFSSGPEYHPAIYTSNFELIK